MFRTHFWETEARFVSVAFAFIHRSVLPRNIHACSAPCSGNLEHALFHERLPLLIGACPRGTGTHVLYPVRGTGDTLCFTSVCQCSSERAPAEHARMFRTLFGELGTRFVFLAFVFAYRSVLPQNTHACSVPCSGNLGHALFYERSRISKHCFSIQIPKQVRNDKFKIIFPHRYFKTSFHKQSQTQNAKRYATPPLGHGRCAQRAPAHACSNQAELRTRNGMQLPPRHGRCAPRAPAHACSNQAKLRTRNGMQLPPGHGRCELSHRRTLAPTKPNLELETVCNCPPRARKVRPTRTGARLLQQSQS